MTLMLSEMLLPLVIGSSAAAIDINVLVFTQGANVVPDTRAVDDVTRYSLMIHIARVQQEPEAILLPAERFLHIEMGRGVTEVIPLISNVCSVWDGVEKKLPSVGGTTISCDETILSQPSCPMKGTLI